MRIGDIPGQRQIGSGKTDPTRKKTGDLSWKADAGRRLATTEHFGGNQGPPFGRVGPRSRPCVRDQNQPFVHGRESCRPQDVEWN